MSLDNFFKLNGRFDVLDSETVLNSILRTGKGCHNALYQPDSWTYEEKVTPLLRGIIFNNCSFSKTQLNNLIFKSCVFEDCLFIGSELNNCEFHNCKFIGCNLYKIELNNCYIDPRCITGIDKWKYPNIGLMVFSELIKSAKDYESYNFQSDAEFYYKVYLRYQKGYDFTGKRVGLLRFWLHFIFDFIWMLISGYGLRSRFVVFSGLVFISILTIINYNYFEIIDIGTQSVEITKRLVDSLFFSVMTITTLGYGNIAPTNPAGKLLIVSQALFGVVWLTACVSVIVKKIVR